MYTRFIDYLNDNVQYASGEGHQAVQQDRENIISHAVLKGWSDDVISTVYGEVFKRTPNANARKELADYFVSSLKSNKWGEIRNYFQQYGIGNKDGVSVGDGDAEYARLMTDSVKESTKEYLSTILKLDMRSDQKKFYEWQYKNAEVIKLTPLSEIRKLYPDLEFRRKYVIKGCYENSSKVCLDNPQVEYVEGYIDLSGFSIEHAWNKIEDKYFDVTSDMVHSGDLSKNEYCKITVIPNEILNKYLHKFKMYDSYMGRYFMEFENRK